MVDRWVGWGWVALGVAGGVANGQLPDTQLSSWVAQVCSTACWETLPRLGVAGHGAQCSI